MIVDTFPMLDRAIVAVLDHSDRAYVIVENVVPTVLGAVKFVEVLRSLGLSQERLRIVLSRYTTLPGSVSPADVANRLGHAVDHVIPFDKGIVIAANTGEPYVLRSRFFGCGRQLRELVDDIDAHDGNPAAYRWPLRITVMQPKDVHETAQSAQGGVAMNEAEHDEAHEQPPLARAGLAATLPESKSLLAGRPGANRGEGGPPRGRRRRDRDPARRRIPATRNTFPSRGPCTSDCWTSSTSATCWPRARRR